MLSPNNPELDPDVVAEKLETVASHRRRPQPLFAKPKAEEFTFIAEPVFQRQGIRGFIKRIPGLGSAVVALNRRRLLMMAPGLNWKQRLRLVPVLGPMALWFSAIARFNAIRHDITLQLAALQGHVSHANQRLDRLAALDIENRLRRFDTLDIERRLNQIEESIRDIVSNGVDQDNLIAGLRQELRRHMHAMTVAAAAAPAPSSSATLVIPASAVRKFDIDTFYMEFECAFRGSRDEILERLKAYLPYIERFRGDGSARAVDVGCGRGEWLELLAGQGMKATGVDLNSEMVELCRERGLAAECEDAIAYLRGQPEGSIAVVSGFHIIEHLPFETLIELFDAALHALREDGIIIFETPNPENVAVGACSFYTDPTHLHPVVPDVAAFIANQRGFARAEILRLHPYPADLHLIEDSEVARRFNRAFYGSQDYAVIAWKTYAN